MTFQEFRIEVEAIANGRHYSATVSVSGNRKYPPHSRLTWEAWVSDLGITDDHDTPEGALAELRAFGSKPVEATPERVNAVGPVE